MTKDFQSILTELGLSKNEALIYQTLLKHGRISASSISVYSKIHRRNVYDSLNRLMEKGYAFEIVQKNDNKYEAVNPQKLMEQIRSKELKLEKILPDLIKLYKTKPSDESVCIYKGIEGWKNYLNKIIETGEDLYTIAGKGAWADDRLESFMNDFIKRARKKDIKFNALYDGEKNDISKIVLESSIGRHKFLPKKFQTTAVIDVFGDNVVIFSNLTGPKIDENATFTLIVNKSVADSFRIWFRMLWDMVD